MLISNYVKGVNEATYFNMLEVLKKAGLLKKYEEFNFFFNLSDDLRVSAELILILSKYNMLTQANFQALENGIVRNEQSTLEFIKVLATNNLLTQRNFDTLVWLRPKGSLVNIPKQYIMFFMEHKNLLTQKNLDNIKNHLNTDSLINTLNLLVLRGVYSCELYEKAMELPHAEFSDRYFDKYFENQFLEAPLEEVESQCKLILNKLLESTYAYTPEFRERKCTAIMNIFNILLNNNNFSHSLRSDKRLIEKNLAVLLSLSAKMDDINNVGEMLLKVITALQNNKLLTQGNLKTLQGISRLPHLYDLVVDYAKLGLLTEESFDTLTSNNFKNHLFICNSRNLHYIFEDLQQNKVFNIENYKEAIAKSKCLSEDEFKKYKNSLCFEKQNQVSYSTYDSSLFQKNSLKVNILEDQFRDISANTY